MIQTDERVILLVEDNPDDELLALRALKKNNFGNRIIVARDGVEALDYFFNNDLANERDGRIMPSLVLLDLNLPRVNGLEVLRQLRSDERTRNLAVVVLTTSDEDKDVVSSYNLGANSFVRKPVEFGEFIEAVKQLGLYWLELNFPSPRVSRG